MADGTKASAGSSASAQDAAAAKDAAAKAPRGNPAFRMMGLPNFRFKLPSRNWLIFLTITGSWTAAVLYDRRQKKLVQKKWCDLVRHIADETIPVNEMPRRVTIYLTAPPGDSIRPTRDHFREYVKPVLVAAALDWDVVEGRREGEVRAGLAERVRKLRKRTGDEPTQTPLQPDAEDVVRDIRKGMGIKEWEGVQGDIVIGRNTWKEYLRGLHEGWLGPLDPPPDPVATAPSPEATAHPPNTETSSTASDPFPPDQPLPADDASPTAPVPSIATSPSPLPAEDAKPAKPRISPPYIPASATAYASAALPLSIPPELPPSAAIPFPHILGFLNTPTRMYRFLHRRHLADDVGRCTAAAVLAAYRPFERSSAASFTSSNSSENSPSSPEEHAPSHVPEQSTPHWEQETVLAHEEKEWHKSVHERKEGDQRERVWTDNMVLDPRIAGRMRKFELSKEEDERAERIWRGTEGAVRRRATNERGQ